MIRLYPHADKLQKDIQELREQLELRQQQNEEEMGRLREAAVQIGDLYDQVHLAEQEQDQLSTERRQAEDEAEHFLYGEAEAFQVRTEMIRKLAVGKQVFRKQ
ncbi:hypothetical protein AK812_SmicGene29406 [Symbiodinium microadriaticum]|uniref:Uncharacterized protein n=1 Tax=Symbiodinium microadriaticum TaxID=2951 RepID=A0A1Q9D1X9_SYMMI|nr:hypothetical protein AK812_SmicGene29406 [Symbiodinium microadriaticum]